MRARLISCVTLVDALLVCAELPADERLQYEAFVGRPYGAEDAACSAFAAPGLKWTIVADTGQPLVVGGFIQLRAGVWQDWLHSTPAAWAPRYWPAVTRLCRRTMDTLLQTEAHRLQCVSLADRTRAHAWYRPLGLEYEGVLRGYGANGQDAKMFARTRTP